MALLESHEGWYAVRLTEEEWRTVSTQEEGVIKPFPLPDDPVLMDLYYYNEGA